MNGAVQGDAMTTARTPEPNASSVRFFDGPAGHARRRELAELEHAGQVERQHEEQDRERADHRRRLQLEAPAQLLAGGAQRGEQPRPARRTSARRPRRTRPASWRSVGRRVVVRREAQHLQRQHREHAGHQVEDQAADERGHDGERERQAVAAGHRRRREIERGRGARARLRPGDDGAGERDVDRRRARARRSRRRRSRRPRCDPSGPRAWTPPAASAR